MTTLQFPSSLSRRMYQLLADGTTKLVESVEQWCRAIDGTTTVLFQSFLPGYNSAPKIVSTIFLGIDTNYQNWATEKPTEEPLLFETMVFEATPDGRLKRGGWTGRQRRYTTLSNARVGHEGTALHEAVGVFYFDVLTHEPAIYQREVRAANRFAAEKLLRTEAWPFGLAMLRPMQPRFVRRQPVLIPYRHLVTSPGEEWPV